MYKLIRHEIKLAQNNWRIYGWDNEMEALKDIYNNKKTSYYGKIQNRVILNGVFGK